MPCEGCGIGVAHQSRDTAECGHGSGHKCCNCALDAGVFNEEQYEEYACPHCRRRLREDAYPGRQRVAGEGGEARMSNRYANARARQQQQLAPEHDSGEDDAEDRYFRVSEEAHAGGANVGQAASRAAAIVADAEIRREQILEQAARDAERIRAEAVSAVEHALHVAGSGGPARRGALPESVPRRAAPAPPNARAAAPGDGGGGAIRVLFHGVLEAKTDSFHADRLLGAGGCGSVYRCEPITGIGNGIPLAVKRFEVAERQPTFLQEALVLGACCHPNLLPILAISIDQGKPPCIVTPLLGAGSLEDRIRGITSALSWAPLLSICCQVARALVYLHTEDSARHKPVILHRDVKPANILLEAVGQDYIHARLADPGMAQVAPELGSGGQTHVTTLQVVGTNGCVDPAVQSTGRYDESSDAYSWGVTLLVVLTGSMPFDGEETEPVLTTRLHDVLHGSDDDAIRIANQAAGWSAEGAREVVQVAKRLLHPVRRQRPSLAAATAPLEHLIAAHYGGAAAGRRGGARAVRPNRHARGPTRHAGHAGGAEGAAARGSGAEMPGSAGGAQGRDGGSEHGAGGGGTDARERQCIVCLSEPRQIRFSCGHAVVCNHCASQVLLVVDS